MIDFDSDGNGVVSFNIPASSGDRRRVLRLSISEYLAYVKSSRSLEELRVLLFMDEQRRQDMLKVKRAGAS